MGHDSGGGGGRDLSRAACAICAPPTPCAGPLALPATPVPASSCTKQPKALGVGEGEAEGVGGCVAPVALGVRVGEGVVVRLEPTVGLPLDVGDSVGVGVGVAGR